MDTKIERVKEIISFFHNSGESATKKRFNITSETIHRYNRLLKNYAKKPPKILLFDIETAPAEVYTFQFWKTNVRHDQIKKDWFVLSWAAKWLYSSDIMSDIVTPKEAIEGDDKRVLKGIWKLFEEADVVIAHNGDRFDIRKLNSRFFINKMKPTSPYRSIDTLTQSRKIFAHSSHRLDHISYLVSKKNKLDTDFQLWVDCVNGKQESLDYMLKYNREDTLILEEVFVEMAPWMRAAPNMALYIQCEEPICGSLACGSNDLTLCGEYTTNVARYDAYRCNTCGCIMRSRKSDLTKEEKQALLSPIAR
jgi:DNA polymerase elongation subunit (family B)